MVRARPLNSQQLTVNSQQLCMSATGIDIIYFPAPDDELG